MLLNGAAFSVLNRAVGRQSIASPDFVLLERAAMRKNLIAIGIYAVAIPVAYYRTPLSLALVSLVAVLYAVPSLWVERCADILEGKDEHRAEHNMGEHGALHEPYTGPPASHD
jgi:hypothetical protein